MPWCVYFLLTGENGWVGLTETLRNDKNSRGEARLSLHFWKAKLENHDLGGLKGNCKCSQLSRSPPILNSLSGVSEKVCLEGSVFRIYEVKYCFQPGIYQLLNFIDYIATGPEKYFWYEKIPLLSPVSNAINWAEWRD